MRREWKWRPRHLVCLVSSHRRNGFQFQPPQANPFLARDLSDTSTLTITFSLPLLSSIFLSSSLAPTLSPSHSLPLSHVLSVCTPNQRQTLLVFKKERRYPIDSPPSTRPCSGRRSRNGICRNRSACRRATRPLQTWDVMRGARRRGEGRRARQEEGEERGEEIP